MIRCLACRGKTEFVHDTAQGISMLVHTLPYCETFRKLVTLREMTDYYSACETKAILSDTIRKKSE